MIELPPKIDKKELVNALLKGVDPNIMSVVNKVNADYEYWDKVKYKSLPEGYTPQMLWTYVHAARMREYSTCKTIVCQLARHLSSASLQNCTCKGA
jgi:hypothetical protein